MIDGVRLNLMIGVGVPVPVGRDVIQALTDVQVTTSTEGPTVFQLAFQMSGRSPLQTLFLLSGGASIPLVRVVISVTIGGDTEVLVDGMMTNHQISPGRGGGPSTLTVIGEDLSRVMDYVDLSGLPYPGMPSPVRVLAALAKYAVFGVVPKVVPTPLFDVPLPVDRIPRHQGTDLAYVKLLADEVGYVFYLEPGSIPGMSFAYWGPEIRVGIPQPALNTDFDAHTNVESLSFGFDNSKAKIPILFIHEENSKAVVPIPVPPITPLSPPLGAVPPIPQGIEPIEGTAKMSPARAVMFGLAAAARSFDVVTGSGSLDVVRYGRTLKARRLVGVRGSGPAFDGLHYVTSVTSKLRRGEFKQDFKLVRNGLVSTLPKVPA
jgi:hypothetical protein